MALLLDIVSNGWLPPPARQKRPVSNVNHVTCIFSKEANSHEAIAGTDYC